ncbi:MAG TPA: AraC family transcriptional regulator [Vicinamibacterales bacterium]|nr:AraC family transcriptional regulator [Vicinamibacterales bacterium]
MSPAGPILSHVLPVERIVAASPSVYAGQFRCAPDHPLFPGGRPCSSFCVVFPREVAWIQHDDGPRFVADMQVATLYNQGQVYRRWSIGRRPDRCDWLAFPAGIVRDAVRTCSPADADHPSGPFRFGFAPITADVYASQRRLFEGLERGLVTDAADVEDRAMALLDAVVRHGYAARGEAAARSVASPRMRDAIEHVRHLLARRPQDRRTLADLAATVDLSPFHLCRAFRRVTGRTITSYRTNLRVRASLERMADGEDLTSIALSLGFVSHSHFTHAFGSVFGVSPSAMRRPPHGAGSPPALE